MTKTTLCRHINRWKSCEVEAVKCQTKWSSSILSLLLKFHWCRRRFSFHFVKFPWVDRTPGMYVRFSILRPCAKLVNRYIFKITVCITSACIRWSMTLERIKRCDRSSHIHTHRRVCAVECRLQVVFRARLYTLRYLVRALWSVEIAGRFLLILVIVTKSIE